jgi:Cdc6-like AAA superfamily ATPase
MAIASQTMFSVVRALSKPGQPAREKTPKVLDVPLRVPMEVIETLDFQEPLPSIQSRLLNGHLRNHRPRFSSPSYRPQLQKWFNCEVPLVWAYGKPGSGKTLMACSVIEELLGSKADSNVGVCYYFFHSTKEGNSTASNLLGCLAAQLIRQHTRGYQLVQDLLDPRLSPLLLHPPDSMEDDYLRGSLHQNADFISHTFRNLQKLFERTFIVIDGVHEGGITTYQSVSRLMSVIRDSENTSLMIIGRDNDVVSTEDFFSDFVQLDVNPTSEDIQAHVQDKIAHYKKTSSISMDEETCQLIVDGLSSPDFKE